MPFFIHKKFKKLQAFSDYKTGWALYNGELRHNSNSSGQKYGKTINAGDVIGVAVDMIEVKNIHIYFNTKLINNLLITKKGTISFYKNNVN